MNTKRIFNDALSELMKEMPLEDITVRHLLDKTTFSRATFYRHFKDKYDLLNWHFHTALQDILNAEEHCTWEDHLLSIYRFFLEDYTYFRKAAYSNTMNSFYDCLYKTTFEYTRQAVLTMRKETELCPEEKIKIDYMSKGLSHIARMWLLGGAKEKPEEIAKWAYELIPAEYCDILNQYIKLRKH